jgi:mannose-6-phosphate isomerase-like protein (cupin superfamily)
MLKITKKPWGEEHIIALCDKYCGKMIYVRKGHRLSLQYHDRKEETLYLFKGSMKLTLGNKDGKLRSRVIDEGHVCHLPPKTIHRMEALKNCLIVEVSTPELDDVVRLADDYHRAAKQTV